ncbi:unnamed protein product, partial [marine sediment metagenome]
GYLLHLDGIVSVFFSKYGMQYSNCYVKNIKGKYNV